MLFTSKKKPPKSKWWKRGISSNVDRCVVINNFYHPLAESLVSRVNLSSIDSLFCRSVQGGSNDKYPLGYAMAGDEQARHEANLVFRYHYLPTGNILGDYPAPIIDFSLDSPYGVYNWEMFFHIPLFIATSLSNDHKYEEAMRWFHYIFNPGGDFTNWEKSQEWVSSLPPGARFWNFLPFFANKGVRDSIYKAVEKSQLDNQDTSLGSLIEEWKNDPFKPHLIARMRIAAYQKSVVMKYLDNLVSWADGLFRLDYMEAINEATQLYVHASEILGKKPLVMPQMHEQPGLTYQQLVAEGLDGFSNAVVQLENYIPPPPPVKIRFWRSRKTPSRYYYYHYDYSYGDNQTVEAVPHRSMQLLRMVPTMHYFCIPKNNRLLSYWDTVDDRLFKIRHSMNIDGVKREIPLFAPPIDPGMLARATSAGISIGALLKDIQSSPGVYRYSIVYQKAVELCNELKSFGSEITAALEKKDAEHLALLRNTHESELLKMVKSIREKAIEEARETMESLVKSKDVIQERYKYYNEIKKYSGLEIAQLATMSYAAAFNIVGQAMVLASAPMKLVPDGFGGALVGLGGGALAFAAFGGGAKASEAMEKTGNAINQNAAIFDRAANIIGINASYLRRWDEWKLQERLAKKELKQIDKQIISAEIRVKIAEIELGKQNKQIEQTEETMEVMESKFSNEELYRWMSDELIKTYNNFYDIAYGTAKKAEKAYQFELGIPSSSFITPEVWDSSRKGLLAGQRLSLQLRQMDNAYMENNKREYEITKTISLSLVNPVGLLELRETGSCQVEIPEYLYDFDFPGQYLRRIKSVSLTIPCVTGPYASINAKLELVHSKVRTSTELKNGKYTQEDEDSRFLVNPIKPMAIATSNAQMDSGVFQLDFRDERYLPFEGAGAISTWKIELPDEFRQFDYGTITDVLIHINYTARDAANEKFKTEVKKQLMTMIDSMTSIPHLISLKNSFPAQFGKIVEMGVSDEDSDVPVTVTLNNNHIPHLIADYIQRHSDNLSLGDVSVFIQMKHPVSDSFDLVLTLNGEESSSPTPISQNRTILQYAFEMNGDVQDLPLGDWEFLLANADRLEIEDIFLFFNYPSRAGQ